MERSDDGFEGWEDADDLDGDTFSDGADSGSGFYRVVRLDGDGAVVPPYSNIVRP